MDILLSDSTMYRILSECGAQIRTSLEGIDYFIAEGGRAFRTILDLLKELLKFQVLNQQEIKYFSAIILQCKQHLRADFKIHISPDSKVADHCQTFALSDSLHPEFAVTCQHHHDLVCVTCEQMKDVLSSLMKTIQCSSNHGLTDSLRDLQSKLQNATQGITNVKRHLIRCRNQNLISLTRYNITKCFWSVTGPWNTSRESIEKTKVIGKIKIILCYLFNRKLCPKLSLTMKLTLKLYYVTSHYNILISL